MSNVIVWGAAIVLFAYGLPASLWAAIAFAVYWLLDAAASKLRRHGDQSKFLSKVGTSAASALSQMAFWFGVGIVCVAVAQVLLGIFSGVVERQQIARIEEALRATHAFAAHYLSLKFLLIGLALFVTVSLFIGQLGLVPRFMKARSLVKRFSLILLAITSFTFFGGEQLRYLANQERHEEIDRAKKSVAELEQESRKILAAAWIEAEVKRLDPNAREQLRKFFDDASKDSSPEDLSKFVTKELAPNVSSPADSVSAGTQQERSLLNRASGYVKAQPVREPPTTADLKEINEQLDRRKKEMSHAREAAIHIATEAIVDLVPGEGHPKLVEAFVKALSEALADGVLKTVVPENVMDFTRAQQWIRRRLIPAESLRAGDLIPRIWRRYSRIGTWQTNDGWIGWAGIRVQSGLWKSRRIRLTPKKVVNGLRSVRGESPHRDRASPMSYSMRNSRKDGHGSILPESVCFWRGWRP